MAVKKAQPAKKKVSDEFRKESGALKVQDLISSAAEREQEEASSKKVERAKPERKEVLSEVKLELAPEEPKRISSLSARPRPASRAEQVPRPPSAPRQEQKGLLSEISGAVSGLVSSLSRPRPAGPASSEPQAKSRFQLYQEQKRGAKPSAEEPKAAFREEPVSGENASSEEEEPSFVYPKTDVREAKRVVQKAKDVEASVVMGEVFGMDFKEEAPKPVRPVAPSRAEPEAPASRRRMYLQRGGEEEKRGYYALEDEPDESLKRKLEKKKAIQEESEALISDIVEQSKKKGYSSSVKSPLSAEREAVEAEGKEAPSKQLFGPASAPAEKGGGEDVFSQLESGVLKKEEPSAKKTEMGSCPTCKAKGVRVVYCPYCGQGFCAKCSPSVDITAEGFEYQCTKCKEKVLIKKEDVSMF